MIVIFAALAAFTALLFLLFTTRFGIKYLVAVKGVIDAGWSQHFAAGLNTNRIVGGLVPLLVMPKVVSRTGSDYFKLPLAKIATAYLISSLWGASLMVAEGSFMGTLSYILRVMNGYVGFFMFQVFFHDRENFKGLLKALIICGLFPMGVAFYGAATGAVMVEETRMAMGFVRNVGVYHDAVAIRMYAFQTVTAILLYLEYFKPGLIRKLLLLAFLAVCCLVIFRAYSKSAILIFGAWAVIWTIFNRKLFLLLLFPLLLLGANVAMDNKIVEDVQHLFSKETGAWTGEVEERYRFSGRTALWREIIDFYSEQDVVQQVMGTGKSVAAHNEYLRVLVANGALGLAVFLFMYLFIGLKVFLNALIRGSPLNVMALMLFAMWSIDNIGVTPGMYPVYQWHVFGFITLALHGVQGLDTGRGAAEYTVGNEAARTA
jgi:hypothetical protein